jgi:hypothetical protein
VLEETVNRLGSRRYVTLVVRLLVHPQDEIQGVVVALDEHVVGQFRELDRLPELIRRWLKDEHLLSGRVWDDIDRDGTA